MITITVPEKELWDEKTETFITCESRVLTLEHSLVSISKWESKWHKPFLDKKEKTREEIIDYVKCMTITQNIKPIVYQCLSNENLKEVNEYISDSMTATWFSKTSSTNRSSETTTSELIYYWMVSLQIPFECEKWHINRLLTLIKICNIKNQPNKKMSNTEVLRQYSALNAARKKQFNTHG